MFDREKMLTNKKNIQYLYGQLKNVHAGNDTLQINEAFLSYSGTHWTTNKGVLLEFLYLGAAVTDYQFVRIFDSKTNSTELNMNNITPTLSTQRSTVTRRSRRGGRPTRASGRSPSNRTSFPRCGRPVLTIQRQQNTPQV